MVELETELICTYLLPELILLLAAGAGLSLLDPSDLRRTATLRRGRQIATAAGCPTWLWPAWALAAAGP